MTLPAANINQYTGEITALSEGRPASYRQAETAKIPTVPESGTSGCPVKPSNPVTYTLPAATVVTARAVSLNVRL